MGDIRAKEYKTKGVWLMRRDHLKWKKSKLCQENWHEVESMRKMEDGSGKQNRRRDEKTLSFGKFSQCANEK